MVQMWKGNYFISNGGEVGLYWREPGQIGSYYNCATEEIPMSLQVSIGDKVLVNRPLQEHWWISGFNIGEKLEDVRVERRPYQYLYQEGNEYVFMNQETFEQVNISGDQINGVAFRKEGMNLEVVTDASTETILFADMPVKVVLAVTYTEPGLKGDTATNTTKPATLETGAEIRVPLFINEGELVEVDTRDGSYVGRVKA
jgi:elongation factor P